MMKRKTILVAPLHWGLGHATRCIPIINELIIHGFKVIIGSDGAALVLLKKEFPKLESINLPSYNIKYPKNGNHFKWIFLLQIPKILNTISAEKKVVAQLISEGKINGIISDNRWGVRHKKIPSVFITHQLNVLSGSTSEISATIHKQIIKKFTECWVPDVKNIPNLSGKMGHIKNGSLPIRYIGPLSRMEKKEVPMLYDILILLSGPEPQRTILEEHLKAIFKDDPRKILLIQGKVEGEEKTTHFGKIIIKNYLRTQALEEALNQSEMVIARSGYTTLMDLTALEKKVFFIPTPGQYEQEYLAKRLKQQGIVPSCKQNSFRIEKLKKTKLYSGLKRFEHTEDFNQLFSLFHSK